MWNILVNFSFIRTRGILESLSKDIFVVSGLKVKRNVVSSQYKKVKLCLKRNNLLNVSIIKVKPVFKTIFKDKSKFWLYNLFNVSIIFKQTITAVFFLELLKI